jgi:LysM repeat protein
LNFSTKIILRQLIFFLFILQSNSLVLAQKAIDTVDTPLGRLLIFENRTWSLMNESSFNGVLNERIHSFVSNNKPAFIQTWNNEVCYTGKNNDLSKLNDTIWLCLNEEESNDFSIPVKGVVTSHYGYRSGRYHNGIDLALKIGDTVYAAFSGKIRYAKYNDGGFGNLVIIRHNNGLETFYAHLSKHLVVPNQDIKSGDPIGLGGNTGRSFGPHLHFEVRFYDGPINPEEIIDFSKKTLKKENLFVHKGLFVPGIKPSEFYEVNEEDEKVEKVVKVEPKPTPVKVPEKKVEKVEPKPKPKPKPVVKVKTEEKKYYTVKSGDSLSEIAARNKTTVSKLCELNGIKPSAKIQIGKSLRIR